MTAYDTGIASEIAFPPSLKPEEGLRTHGVATERQKITPSLSFLARLLLFFVVLGREESGFDCADNLPIGFTNLGMELCIVVCM